MVFASIALMAALFNKKLFSILAAASVALLLGYRIIELGRPPVATLGETALFVAFCFLTVACLQPKLTRPLSLLAAFLLLIAPLSLDPIQPVLRSSWWLTIHVLTIVTSYALLLIASLIGHIILVTKARLDKLLERFLSLGTILLIIGTLLGGLWAKESWGRFWDFDPKESWAFISASIYLLAIHALHRGKIATFGLALFSVIGGAAITFTWYGVNTIITKGLHTYGHSQAPLWPYLTFLLLEGAFCLFVSYKKLFAKKDSLVDKP